MILKTASDFNQIKLQLQGMHSDSVVVSSFRWRVRERSKVEISNPFRNFQNSHRGDWKLCLSLLAIEILA